MKEDDGRGRLHLRVAQKTRGLAQVRHHAAVGFLREVDKGRGHFPDRAGEGIARRHRDQEFLPQVLPRQADDFPRPAERLSLRRRVGPVRQPQKYRRQHAGGAALPEPVFAVGGRTNGGGERLSQRDHVGVVPVQGVERVVRRPCEATAFKRLAEFIPGIENVDVLAEVVLPDARRNGGVLALRVDDERGARVAEQRRDDHARPFSGARAGDDQRVMLGRRTDRRAEPPQPPVLAAGFAALAEKHALREATFRRIKCHRRVVRRAVDVGGGAGRCRGWLAEKAGEQKSPKTTTMPMTPTQSHTRQFETSGAAGARAGGG